MTTFQFNFTDPCLTREEFSQCLVQLREFARASLPRQFSGNGALPFLDPKTQKTVIVPLDHGVHDGPVLGLEDMAKILQVLKDNQANAVVLHKGMAARYSGLLENMPFLLHLSASSCMGQWLKKVLVSSVDDAIDLGACGVSVHVNMGNKYEPKMLRDLGNVASECKSAGMPLLAMMYIRDEIRGQMVYDNSVEKVKHAARVAAELGADIVKVPYTGSVESFKEVVKGCPIPVVMAGGTVSKDHNILLHAVENIMEAGAAGTSIGRGIFQHPNPEWMLKAVQGLVHKENVK